MSGTNEISPSYHEISPTEKDTLSVTWSNLGSGVSVSSATVKCYNSSGTDVTSDVISNVSTSNDVTTFTITAPTTEGNYDIVMTATLSNADKRVAKLRLIVNSVSNYVVV